MKRSNAHESWNEIVNCTISVIEMSFVGIFLLYVSFCTSFASETSVCIFAPRCEQHLTKCNRAICECQSSILISMSIPIKMNSSTSNENQTNYLPTDSITAVLWFFGSIFTCIGWEPHYTINRVPSYMEKYKNSIAYEIPLILNC